MLAGGSRIDGLRMLPVCARSSSLTGSRQPMMMIVGLNRLLAILRICVPGLATPEWAHPRWPRVFWKHSDPSDRAAYAQVAIYEHTST